MVENKVNQNTVLVVLVVGIVGILFLGNNGFLSGETIKVQKVTTGTDIYTKTEIDANINSGIFLGNNFFSLKVSGLNSVYVGDRKVTLLNVGEGGSVLVDVAGIRDTISAGSTKDIAFLGITNVATNYNTATNRRSAVLKIIDTMPSTTTTIGF